MVTNLGQCSGEIKKPGSPALTSSTQNLLSQTHKMQNLPDEAKVGWHASSKISFCDEFQTL